MVLAKLAEVSCPDSKSPETAPATITDVKHLSSYNWMDVSAPTIAIPGSPSLWSPPKKPQKLEKDSGLIVVAQNAARHPDSPMEPLFRALYIADPSFDIHTVDVVTDRNNIRKLLSFINPNLEKNGLEPFSINVEVTRNTAIFSRTEAETVRFLGPHDFRGFGHAFEKAYTTSQLDGSTGHHRIISYKFSDMKFLVRHETDGYVDIPSQPSTRAKKPENDDLSSMLESLSLDSNTGPSYTVPVDSKLIIKEVGKVVPIESTLELKTRVFHKPICIKEVLPQLWVSQTPNLVRAYHKGGVF